MISLSPDRLKEILLEEGIVNSETFDFVRREAERKRQNPVDILISQNLVTKEYFLAVAAKALGVSYINLGREKIDEKFLKLLPEDIARKKRAIVFGKEVDGRFRVAMEDPTDLEAVDFLSSKLQGGVSQYLASDDDLDRGFILYQKQLTQDFKKILDDSIKESLRSKLKGDPKESATELPIVAIVDNLLAYAISGRASDIHFEILDDVVLIRFRIDGVLHEIIRMPKEIHPAVVARMKILSSLRVDEHTHPQDGRFRHRIGEDVIDIRVSIIPTFYGEKIELRLLSGAAKPLSFQELGIFEDTAKILEEGISKTYGMVLVCGPTGSGKTTTLYSILNLLNKPEVNIISIEDPIEYDMRYVNQMQVNVAAGITFASGLRSILRQDPNIILVGEVRDSETANISVQAALTGHLVLSSLHTNDASGAIPRLMDMGVQGFLVAAVLNVVSSQRLARKIHLDCIESYTPEKGMVDAVRRYLKESGLDLSGVKLPNVLYRGRGCNACNHTGSYVMETIQYEA
ncbi:MAG: ATPase, T2SS/T4P/T4SS family, partial [Patescibacteria group bacterium]